MVAAAAIAPECSASSVLSASADLRTARLQGPTQVSSSAQRRQEPMVRSSRDWMAPAVGMNSGSVSVATTARSARDPSCSLPRPDTLCGVIMAGGRPSRITPRVWSSMLGNRGAVAVTHPRVGSAEPIPGSECPAQVDESGEDVDSLGEFGPGESAGRTHVERGGDTSDAGRRCVDGLDDIGVVEVAAGDLVAIRWCESEATAAVWVEKAGQDRRRVERRKCPPVHTAVGGKECDGPPVAEHGVVLYRCEPVYPMGGAHETNVPVLCGASRSPDCSTWLAPRANGIRPMSGPSAMTMARPSTRPMRGAPGFASPVVMRSAVAAEGAWCDPTISSRSTVMPTADHCRGYLTPTTATRSR